MTESLEGVVIEADGENVRVKLSKHAECSFCGSCQGDNSVVLSAYNLIGAKPGQAVIIKMEKDNDLRAAFIMFGLPIMAVLAGVVTGELFSAFFMYKSAMIDVFTGCVFFVLSIALIIRYDKCINRKNKIPVVIKIK